jgi:hypothetical protein
VADRSWLAGIPAALPAWNMLSRSGEAVGNRTSNSTGAAARKGAYVASVRAQCGKPEDVMKHVKSALVAIVLSGFFACGVEPFSEDPAPPETVAQVEQASGSCWACFTEWSYCDDNCTSECEGAEDWNACFHQCQERCADTYYRCFSSCEI